MMIYDTQQLVAVIRKGKQNCKYLSRDQQVVIIPTKEVERDLFLRTLRRVEKSALKAVTNTPGIPYTDLTEVEIPPFIEQPPIIPDIPPLSPALTFLKLTSKPDTSLNIIKLAKTPEEALMRSIEVYQLSKSEEDRSTSLSLFYRTYDHRIEATIKKMKFNVSKEKIQDLKSKVYERIIDQDVLARFDKQKGKLATIVYLVTNTVVRNNYHKYKKEESITGYLDDQLPTHSDKSFDTTNQDFLADDTIQSGGCFCAVEENDLHSRIEKHLKDEKLIKTFRMIHEGYKVKEVAKELKVTVVSAGHYCRSVRKSLVEFMVKQELINDSRADFLLKLKRIH